MFYLLLRHYHSHKRHTVHNPNVLINTTPLSISHYEEIRIFQVSHLYLAAEQCSTLSFNTITRNTQEVITNNQSLVTLIYHHLRTHNFTQSRLSSTYEGSISAQCVLRENHQLFLIMRI